MLIRPHQALQLARSSSKLLIFNNIFKIYGIQASLSDLYQVKEDHPYSFVLFHTFSRPSYLTHCRGSKLALLHRVKERKAPSLSALASFAPFSLKVAWSGKSLIRGLPPLFHNYSSCSYVSQPPLPPYNFIIFILCTTHYFISPSPHHTSPIIIIIIPIHHILLPTF